MRNTKNTKNIQKKTILALAFLAVCAGLAWFVAACETNILTTPGNKTTEDEFAGEEYPEDWEWPELMTLTLLKDGAPVPAEGLTLMKGDSVTLTASRNGQEVPAADLYWVSSKPGAVSVEKGVVTALGKGYAYIKATMKTSGDEGVSPVTAKAPAGLYEIDEKKDLSEIGTDDDSLLVKAFMWIKENSKAGWSYTIVLDSDINDDTTAGFAINFIKNLTITLEGLNEPRTITKTKAGALFTVSGSTDHLILGENITLAGLNENTTPSTNTSALVVVSAGTLTMKDGSRITGNINSNKTTSGGGVHVSTVAGNFIMEGGKIDNNKVPASQGKGGGVINAGTFSMTGGTIEDNSAGSASSCSGGGVYCGGNSIFTMTGGTIQNNIATSAATAYGGGVYVGAATGVFEMSGTARISNNTAKTGGGGVAHTGSFSMSGGIIEGNTSEGGNGGGVLAYYVFTMSGTAVIKNNQAANGGGVNIQSGANYKFIMTDGTIEGNRATAAGAAVHKGNTKGLFEKTGGTIYGINAGAQSNKKADSVAAGTTIHSIEMALGGTLSFFDNDAGPGVSLKHVDNNDKSDNWSTTP